MKRVSTAVILLALLGVTACGDETTKATEPPTPIPSWARVAPEQIAEAKKHGVPVAFENDLGMRFVLIPAGTFLMGSPEDEPDRYDNEEQHRVTLPEPYYMQTTEVTNAQYRSFQSDHDSRGDSRSGKRLSLNGEDQPVVWVSWDNAQDFLTWLSAQEDGRTYRLPMEAEWERAARARTMTPYFFGGNMADLGKYGNVADKNTDDGHEVTAPVGSYRASPWGLYDVHGNAYEWCSDCWHRTHGDETPGGSTWVARVIRGGAWSGAGRFARSASRNYDTPSFSNPLLGFRLLSPLPEGRE